MRRHAPWALFAVPLLVLLVAGLTGAAVPFRNDFAAYWPVGHLLLEGRNPYDAAAIEAVQRSLGDSLGGDSVVRYPPWSLPLLVPMSVLPYPPAWHAWIALQAVLVGVASVWMWRLLGGGSRPGVPLLVGFAFPPGLFVALGGQIDGLLFLGVTGFLWAILARRDISAGFFLGLLTLKPHLFLPLGLVALLWALRERRWLVPVTVCVTILMGAAIAIMLRPSVFADYLQLLGTAGTSWQRAVASGTLLGWMLDSDSFWAQWLPAIGVSGVVLLSWLHAGQGFEWRRDLPVLLVLGLLAAPYLLVHDLVLLVPALLAGALCVVRWKPPARRWLAGFPFLALCLLVWIGQIAEGTVAIHVWIVPLMLIPAIVARRCVDVGAAGGVEGVGG